MKSPSPLRVGSRAASLRVISVLLQSVVRENIDGWANRSQRPSQKTLNLGPLTVSTTVPTSLGQFEVTEFPLHNGRPVSDPGEVCEILQLTGARERFVEELRHCVQNLSYAREAVEARRENNEAAPKRVFEFEQWVTEGHPLHPCAKMRWPLTLAEQKDYAPEFGARFELPLVAIQNTHCQSTGIGSNQALARDYPQLWTEVQKQIDTESFTVLAVHPYQFAQVLPKMYDQWMNIGVIQRLEGLSIPVAPLMSFRSLEPIEEKLYQIKTAVSVRMTNAVRTVSPQAAENGPELSRFLRELDAQDSLAPLHILHEVGGAYFSADDWDLGRSLSLLFRESPERFVGPNQVGMPAASLIEKGHDGRLVALGLVEAAGSAEAFVDSYCQTVLPPLLKLLSRYGVALEAHLQNCVVIFERGRLCKVLYRDFGGVRFHTRRLEHLGREVHFHPGSATVVDDVSDLQSKLFYPLFQNHLGELFRALSQHGLDEAKAWQRVREICQETFDKTPGPFVAEDRAALFGPFWQLKRLAWMRLHDKVTEYTFSPLLNPLFESETRRFQRELEQLKSPLSELYPEAVKEARVAVSKQLHSAMIRENLTDPETPLQATTELLIEGYRDHPEMDWPTLALEIDNAVANMALILSHRAAHPRSETPWQRLKQAPDSLLLSESLCLQGHNLHPCARTRLAIGVEALLNSAAELDARPKLRLVSLAADKAGWALSPDYEDPNEIARELFPDYPFQSGRVYLLMHQWQCREVIPKIYAEELREGTVRFEEAEITGGASASFRTVILNDTWTVKASVGSQMTSTTRCISHQTALNGPAISQLLESLRCQIGGFELLAEPGGVHFKSADTAKSRNLTCVYRRSLNGFLEPAEIAVSGASLTTVLPEILSEYEGTAKEFLEDYLNLVIPVHLRLFGLYGVALEGHLQNCIITFRQAKPHRLFLRDWGGLRIDCDRLNEAGFEVDLAAGSLTRATSTEAARDKLAYCLFRAHIEEIVKAIADLSKRPIEEHWEQVRACCLKVYETIDRSQDKDYFLAPTWKLKALTRMRLNPDAGYTYVEGPNPLHRRE